MRRAVTAVLVVLALAGGARSAAAHQASFTYGRLTADPDGHRVVYEIKIRTTDLFEALGGGSGDDPSERALRAAEARLYDYVAARVELSAPGQTCTTERVPLEIASQSERFAILGFALRCPRPIAEAVLDYDLFFDLDAGHIGLVTVDGGVTQLRRPDHTRLSWILGGAPIDGLVGFVRSGVEHILFGLDHILFLVSLLLVAVIRPVHSAGTGFELRRPGSALRYTAVVVTAITIAHSQTLIGAALGWFSLPGRLVESVIAGSIVYVAIENVVRPDPPRRYLITFAFGLIHGLGFASMLTPLLPPDRIVLPLLAFNVGVELGQLGLVAIFLPALLGLARGLGAARYRRNALSLGAVALGSIGLIWLVERGLAVTLLDL
jgi:hypothetical protein